MDQSMNPSSNPSHPAHNPQHSWTHPADSAMSMVPQSMRVQARRDLFWSNVVRDSLMALASAAANSSARLSPTPTAAQHSTSPVDDLFDGRMGIITSLGQRIPIADIFPVFACSSVGTHADRERSADVQCTIFRVTTPTGETYTLPISQIIGIHSLSEDLINQLESASEDLQEQEADFGDRTPFGFAAYTSLARSEAEQNAARGPETKDQADSGSKTE
jgi:hypothetical protein